MTSHQSAKCANKEEFEEVRKSGPGYDVWAAGSKVQMRPDWEIIKIRKMYEGNFAKFEQNEAFRKKRLSTVGPVKFEGFSFWCPWNARIIELVREELRGEQGDKEKIKELWKMIEDYEREQGRQD